MLLFHHLSVDIPVEFGDPRKGFGDPRMEFGDPHKGPPFGDPVGGGGFV